MPTCSWWLLHLVLWGQAYGMGSNHCLHFGFCCSDGQTAGAQRRQGYAHTNLTAHPTTVTALSGR